MKVINRAGWNKPARWIIFENLTNKQGKFIRKGGKSIKDDSGK